MVVNLVVCKAAKKRLGCGLVFLEKHKIGGTASH